MNPKPGDSGLSVSISEPTIEVVLPVPEALHDPFVIQLDALGFEAFWEEPDRLKAYMPASQWRAAVREAVRDLLRRQELPDKIEVRTIKPENWNARWESQLQPIAVGPFLIKPSWHAVPAAYATHIVLEIDPKMSFGTGYHESTRLVLQMLPDCVEPGARVLDAGTGTGILTIAALKLGAGSAIAFDIDPWAAENAQENFARNGVADRVEFRQGSIEVVPERDFDLILANIHRRVLCDLLPAFREKVRPTGYVLLSGLLREERELMLEAAAAHDLEPIHEATENAWWAVMLQRAI